MYSKGLQVLLYFQSYFPYLRRLSTKRSIGINSHLDQFYLTHHLDQPLARAYTKMSSQKAQNYFHTHQRLRLV